MRARYIKTQLREIPLRLYFFLLVFQYIHWAYINFIRHYIYLVRPITTSMKTKYTMIRTVLLFVFATVLVNAQKSREQKIDGLEKELSATKSDSIKIVLKCKLSQNYAGIDSLRSFELGYQALELSQKTNNKSGLANAYFALGYGYGNYDDTQNSKKYYSLAKELYGKLIAINSSEQNINLWVMTTYNLGTIYGREGYVNEELKSMIEVAPLVEKMKDTGVMAILSSNLGIRFSNLEHYDKAYEYFKKSNVLFEKSNRINGQVYGNLAFSMCLYKMDSITEMRSILDKVKKELDKMPKAREWDLYFIYRGLYHTSIKEYEKALSYYEKAKETIDKNKMTAHLEELYSGYMTTYDAAKNNKMSKVYALKYTALLGNNTFGEKRMNAYKILAEYEEKDKNFSKAYEYLTKYRQLKDSITIDSMNMEIRQLELLYQTEKKEKRILDLKNKNNVTALALEKRLSLSYFMIMTIGILVIVLTIGYIIYKNKLRKAQIKERKRETEVKELRQEQQNKIFSAMIESQEKERKRLAINLHDGLGGRLSGISLNLSKLNKDEPKQYPKKQLRKVMKDLADSLTELRGIARNMMPETLLKFGLYAALKDYCSSMNSNRLKVTLQFYGSDKGISTNQQVTMYRVIQELINNAIKHARASEVLVQYMREGNIIDITVEDNGVGMDKEVLENEASGMGLANLRTRVAYLNGDLDFQTVENEGTTVNVHINIDAA